ncbi:MAG: hypothetical protein JW720_11985 [Sedimentisphaerales bacterium]|nr:hypothetical protein [Sedimentisphaerales bacterium]
MKCRSNCMWMFRWKYVPVLIITVSAVMAESSTDAETYSVERSRLEYYSVPLDEWRGSSDMVVDHGGIVWVTAGKKVLYFTGTKFSEPVSGPLLSGDYLTGLYGGPDRGAYVTQVGQEEHEGLIYRLDNGTALFTTTFYYENKQMPPGLYVSKSGVLFNWGERFLSRFNGKTWDRIEARLSLRFTVVFDMGEKVYFYYDNALYCAGKSGELQASECPEHKWVRTEPGQNHIIGVLWAGHKALLVNYGQPGLFAFDLETGREVELSTTIASKYLRKRFNNGFSLRNGEVWISGGSCAFYRLSIDGVLSEIHETEGLYWDNKRCWQFPEAVLETSDGVVTFGLPEDGLALIRNGDFEHWGWIYGLAEGTRHLHEDLQGNIWFPLDGKIAKLTLAQNAPAKCPIGADWEEIGLARGNIWALATGELAMFRQDRKGKLSRWDGKEWKDQEVPFDTKARGISACDDRGHLLLMAAYHPNGYYDDKGYYDISVDSTKRHNGINPMLVDAVSNGARKFRCDDGSQVVVVTPDNRIWFGRPNSNEVQMYDGKRWDTLRFSGRIDHLYRSLEYGMLLRTHQGQFYRYDRGQMVETSASKARSRWLMTSERLLQPYERALVDESPDTHFPVMYEDGKGKLFFKPDDFEMLMEERDTDETYDYAELPGDEQRLSPAPSGGAWLFTTSKFSNRLRIWRIFGNKMIGVGGAGISDTPIAWKRIRDIKEDSNGDLWFLTANRGIDLACRYKLSTLRLDVGTAPKTCGRELNLRVNVTPTRMTEGIRLLSRINKGEWTLHQESDTLVLLRFPKSGKYHCEITGFKLTGRIRNSVSFDILADVSLPESTATASQENQ